MRYITSWKPNMPCMTSTYRDFDNCPTTEEPLFCNVPPFNLLNHRPEEHTLPWKETQGINCKPCCQISTPDFSSSLHNFAIRSTMLCEKVQKQIDKEPKVCKNDKPVIFVSGSVANINMSHICRHKGECNGGHIPHNFEFVIGWNQDYSRFSLHSFLFTSFLDLLPTSFICLIFGCC